MKKLTITLVAMTVLLGTAGLGHKDDVNVLNKGGEKGGVQVCW
jgi:hypothetical protein